MHTLLVVDDQHGVRSLLREVFHQEGLCVLTAATGTEALIKLRLSRPDLMLLDLKLPEIDGWMVLREVHGLYPFLRVIIITASYDKESTRQLLDSPGVVAVVAKPFDLWRLRKLVTSNLHTTTVQ